MPLADRRLGAGVLRRQHQSACQHGKSDNETPGNNAPLNGVAVETAADHDARDEVIQVY